jgi:HEPN domain-containing protein
MADDPIRLADTRAWIDRAATDLRAARHALTAEPSLLGDAVFHCQQAVEKSFKALLTWKDAAFRKTHSLEELGQACLADDEALKPLVDRAVPLTEYAWRYRYPGEPDEPARPEADEALAVAQAVWDAVLERLPGEIRSPAE